MHGGWQRGCFRRRYTSCTATIQAFSPNVVERRYGVLTLNMLVALACIECSHW